MWVSKNTCMLNPIVMFFIIWIQLNTWLTTLVGIVFCCFGAKRRSHRFLTFFLTNKDAFFSLKQSTKILKRITNPARQQRKISVLSIFFFLQKRKLSFYRDFCVVLKCVVLLTKPACFRFFTATEFEKKKKTRRNIRKAIRVRIGWSKKTSSTKNGWPKKKRRSQYNALKNASLTVKRVS